MIPIFPNAEASHAHSLTVLNDLYEHDDFMDSIRLVLDLGCGAGLDLDWWATRTTRDLDNPRPLNITCMGIDLPMESPMVRKHKNVVYQSHDFEKPLSLGKKKPDVLWCHDSFQYVLNPFETLRYWRDLANKNAMLVIMVPQTTNVEFNKLAFELPSCVYWHWTVINLMYVLAVSGWDVAGGYFRKQPNDPWISVVVYRDDRDPLDPRTTGWYHLAELGRIPESAVKSVNSHGYIRQQDLTLPWIDRSLHWFGIQ